MDRRLNAFRPDLADLRLKGRVEAARYVSPSQACVTRFFADLKAAPDEAAGVDTQLLHGDTVHVFEEKDGWSWVQSARDSYVGYVAADAIGAPAATPTHTVRAPRTFLYPQADMKAPRSGYRSMGSLLAVAGYERTRGMEFARLASGDYVFAGHLRPVEDHAADHVAVAETLLHAPYLWGGTTGFGLDCSGIVQLSFRMAGRSVLRDTDMQAATIGEVLGEGGDRPKLQRGDLVFWNGHVAIATGANELIHANAHTMMVSRETVDAAIERIGRMYGQPTVYRRP